VSHLWCFKFLISVDGKINFLLVTRYRNESSQKSLFGGYIQSAALRYSVVLINCSSNNIYIILLVANSYISISFAAVHFHSQGESSSNFFLHSYSKVTDPQSPMFSSCII